VEVGLLGGDFLVVAELSFPLPPGGVFASHRRRGRGGAGLQVVGDPLTRGDGCLLPACVSPTGALVYPEQLSEVGDPICICVRRPGRDLRIGAAGLVVRSRPGVLPFSFVPAGWRSSPSCERLRQAGATIVGGGFVVAGWHGG